MAIIATFKDIIKIGAGITLGIGIYHLLKERDEPVKETIKTIKTAVVHPVTTIKEVIDVPVDAVESVVKTVKKVVKPKKKKSRKHSSNVPSKKQKNNLRERIELNYSDSPIMGTGIFKDKKIPENRMIMANYEVATDISTRGKKAVIKYYQYTLDNNTFENNSSTKRLIEYKLNFARKYKQSMQKNIYKKYNEYVGD